MHDVVKIEIVIGKSHLDVVVDALNALGVPGLTILDTLAGYGDRGAREGGELSDAMVNRYVLTTCRPDQIDEFSSKLEPILRRYGGLCLLSDAKVIRDEA